MIFHRKNKSNPTDRVEQRFQSAVGLVKDLDKTEFKRLMEGIELAYKGYERIRAVQTRDEKENKEVLEAEKELEYVPV